MEKCLLCGRRAKYICDGGCRDDEIAFCGYCSRLKIVVWIGRAMEQRLCAVCALRNDNPRENGIFDAAFYTKKEMQELLDSLKK